MVPIDAKISRAFTPLHLAADKGKCEVVRALIKAGANPDIRTPDGATPLYMAAQGGHLNAMRELLRGKANPSLNHVQPQGITSVALDIAAQIGHSDVVRELVQELGIEGSDAKNAGIQALWLAASQQHLDIMAILTGAGVVDTGIALFGAAGLGLEAPVKFLLRHRPEESGHGVEDAHMNGVHNAGGYTTLAGTIHRCPQHAPRIVRLLIDAGADTTSPVRVTGSNGALRFCYTPLALTTSCLHFEKSKRQTRY